MSAPITLITGGNQGLGLAIATILSQQHGHHVIIGARKEEAGRKVATSLQAGGHKASWVRLDLTSQDTIDKAAQTINKEFGKLDVLINNAGILLDGLVSGQSLRDVLNETFATNVVGTACVTEAMSPLLRKSSAPRVIFISSRMGSLHQATVRGTPFYGIDYKAYDASKAATNMLALNYSRNLSDAHAKVNVVCPGLVKTKLNGYMEHAVTPEEGAKRIVELATAKDGGPEETFSDINGPIAW